MKKCTSMDEVRTEIDRLDETLVPLLIERLGYVSQAGQIKKERSMVRDNWRIEDVVSKAVKTAAIAGGNTDYIDALYRHLIELSIKHEYNIWDSKKSA